MTAEEKTSNPYSTPTTDVPPLPVQVDFAEIIRGWERMRIAYNGLQAAIVMVLTLSVYPGRILDLRYWISVVACGVFANVCYLAGPTAEGYGRFLGLWSPGLTKVVFIAGMILTAMLAVLFIVTFR